MYILQSRRSHADQNKRVPFMKYIEEYYDILDPTLYCYFHSEVKFGINPKPRYNMAPAGLYCFPLEYLFSDDFTESDHLTTFSSKYISVFKRMTNKVLNLDKPLPNFKNKLTKLKKVFMATFPNFDKRDFKINVEHFTLNGFRERTTAAMFYKIIEYTCRDTVSMESWQIAANIILRKMGYDYVEDNDSNITPDMMTQTFFTSTKGIKLLETIKMGKNEGTIIHDWLELIAVKGSLNHLFIDFLYAYNTLNNKPVREKSNRKIQIKHMPTINEFNALDKLRSDILNLPRWDKLAEKVILVLLNDFEQYTTNKRNHKNFLLKYLDFVKKTYLKNNKRPTRRQILDKITEKSRSYGISLTPNLEKQILTLRGKL